MNSHLGKNIWLQLCIIPLMFVALWLFHSDYATWAAPTRQEVQPAALNALVPLQNVVQVAAGGYHTCILNTSGGVKCWGRNDGGQLGYGASDYPPDKNSPVDVIGLDRGIRSIAAGGYHTCALTTGGGVKCWGKNGDGQLGDGTTENKSSPVNVVGLDSGVVAIAASYTHTCALTSAGGVKCWGYNSFGQLGDNTTTKRSIPTDVIGLDSGIQAIVTGYGHSCALNTGGGVKCWGYNFLGQLGDNTKVGPWSSFRPISRKIGAKIDRILLGTTVASWRLAETMTIAESR